MISDFRISRKWAGTWYLLIIFMVIKLAIHLFTLSVYELQRDAYMYIDLGNHMAWGFHSVPPSIAVFANISRFLFGDTTFAIRLFPAVAGVLSLMLIGIMVKEAGGGKWAQFFALLAFLISPAFLRSNSLFQPVSFNQFYWLLLSFFLFRLMLTDKKYYWYLIGIGGGLAFLNKYSVVFFLLGVAVVVALTPLRKWFRSPQPYISAAIALIIVLPNLIWQHANHWPVINHMEELARTQLVNVSLKTFLTEQILMFFPVFIIWILGLIYISFIKAGVKFRAFAWIYLVVILLLIFFRGKPYYSIGVYSMLFVFGGLFIERYLRNRLAWLKYAIITFALLTAIFLIPLSLPVLKPDAFIEFYRGTPLENSHRWEDGKYYDLPQDYADMIGWKELCGIVAETYLSLSADQQTNCTILANNYGEAGSVNFYGKKLGLPRVISYNDSYIFWTPDSIKADHLIKIGESHNLEELYEKVEIVGRISTPHARQLGTPVYYCTGQKTDVNRVYREELENRRNIYKTE